MRSASTCSSDATPYFGFVLATLPTSVSSLLYHTHELRRSIVTRRVVYWHCGNRGHSCRQLTWFMPLSLFVNLWVPSRDLRLVVLISVLLPSFGLGGWLCIC